MEIEASPYPFAVRLYADDRRPAHHHPPQDGLCGWMRVSTARLEFPFAKYESQLISCVDEEGYPVSAFLKQQILSLRRSGPKPVDLWPPEEGLDAVEEMLTTDFIGTVDLENFALLEREITERDFVQRRMEQRVELLLEAARTYSTERQRQRRDPRTPLFVRADIDRWLSSLSVEIDKLGHEQRAEAARIRASTDPLEEQIHSNLGAIPDVEHHCTFYWEVRHRRTTVDQIAARESVRINQSRRQRG